MLLGLFVYSHRPATSDKAQSLENTGLLDSFMLHVVASSSAESRIPKFMWRS